MCGLAGIVGDFVPGLAARMNAAQAHRGPDGSGIFEDPDAKVALAHVRLAILDLSPAGAQPMHSDDGRYVLVYNGEIYNYLALRDIVGGGPLRSTGDTEVLLRGLVRFGSAFLDKLDGIFTLALWDRHERELLLARDPVGVKPLYITESVPGALIFASELKAICAHPRMPREPDFVALQQHLAFCHATGERTALRGVRRVRPGGIVRWRAGSPLRTAVFGAVSYREKTKQPWSEAVRELEKELELSTERQLISDVPVGTFLSGGLDSSLLTTIAAKRLGTRLRAYTITYPESDNSLDQFDADAPHARTLARGLDLPLEEISLSPDVAALWPQLIHNLDEPIADPAAIACYLISRAARQAGVPVLLSGQGADELFGGYPRYRAMQLTRPLDVLPHGARVLLAELARHVPGSRGGRLGAAMRRVRRVVSAMDEGPDARFLSYCGSTPQSEISRVLSPMVRAEIGSETAMSADLALLEQHGLSGLDRFLDRDMSVYLPNHNLLYTDKMGMAVGIEVRVPLLSEPLVRLAASYPEAWKVNRTATKAILRAAAKEIVPTSILTRPKAGFGAPFRKWLRHDLHDMWNDLTSERSVRHRGWFEHGALADVRARSQSGTDDLYMLQWAVLTIELWARQFIDHDPSAGVNRL